jgi:hypothetical protein
VGSACGGGGSHATRRGRSYTGVDLGLGVGIEGGRLSVRVGGLRGALILGSTEKTTTGRLFGVGIGFIGFLEDSHDAGGYEVGISFWKRMLVR